MRRFSLFPLVLCLLLCLGAAGAEAAPAKIKPSDIPTMDAGELLKRITSEKGKVVVVNVFASWCPPCREEIPALINIRRAFPENEMALIGVSVDREPAALAKYIGEMFINYPVFLARGDFVQRVGVTAVPQLLIYNKQGELAVSHRGLADEADLKKALAELLAE